MQYPKVKVLVGRKKMLPPVTVVSLKVFIPQIPQFVFAPIDVTKTYKHGR